MNGNSRNERRARERELDKRQSEFKKLTPAQLKMVEKMAEDKASSRIADEVQDAFSMFNICLSALYIEENEECKTEDIVKYMDGFNQRLIEEMNNNDMLLNKSKGDVRVMKNIIDKDMEKVVELSRELINNGKNQSESKTILVEKFPLISANKLVNAYKKVKEEVRKQTVDLVCESIDSAAEYIIGDDSEVKTEIVKSNEEIKPIEERVLENSKSKLKVVKKEIELDGEFGRYKATEAGVEINGITYESLDEVDNYRREEMEKLGKQIRELNEVFAISGINL